MDNHELRGQAATAKPCGEHKLLTTTLASLSPRNPFSACKPFLSVYLPP